jgi:hypothetical protein
MSLHGGFGGLALGRVQQIRYLPDRMRLNDYSGLPAMDARTRALFEHYIRRVLRPSGYEFEWRLCTESCANRAK